jgi:hypothetical protein
MSSVFSKIISGAARQNLLVLRVFDMKTSDKRIWIEISKKDMAEPDLVIKTVWNGTKYEGKIQTRGREPWRRCRLQLIESAVEAFGAISRCFTVLLARTC